MTFENITHFLSKEAHKTDQVPNEQLTALQNINTLPSSINPNKARVTRNKFAELSMHEKAA